MNSFCRHDFNHFANFITTNCYGLSFRSRNSSVGIETDHCLDSGSSVPLFSTLSIPALGPTQLPAHWVLGAISAGVKRPEREADRSLPSSTEVKNGKPISLFPHMSSWHSS
jgi:hypothetical protein